MLNLEAGKQPMPAAEESKKAWSLFLPYIWILILILLVLAGSSLLFIIPGIYFGVALSFSYIILIDQNIHGTQALGASRALVKGRWWGTLWRSSAGGGIFGFLFMLVMAVVIGGFAMIIGFSSLVNSPTDPLVSGILQLVQTVVTAAFMPLFAAYEIKLYRTLKAQPHVETPVINKGLKIKAYILIIGSWLILPLVLFAWAILFFVISRIGLTSETHTAANIINIVLGFLGIIGIIAIPILLPIGLRLLKKSQFNPNEKYDERSGEGTKSTVPEEIKQWSWGGFGLGTLWGIYHGAWISLLLFIPIVNLIVTFYLGFKGNEIAWKKNKWRSIEDFNDAQREWGLGGALAFVPLAFYLLMILIGIFAPARP